MPVSEAAWTQTQQITPFYKPVPMEAQPSAVQTLIDWADIRMNLARDRACPMIDTGDIAMAVNYDAQGQNQIWERLNHEVVKDFIKAIRDNGLGSSYFKQLLKSTFNIYDLTPYDLRSFASLILTDTQALIWDSRWRRVLAELRTKYQGGPNAAPILVQLAGDPLEDNPTQQARLPHEVLADIKEAACKAVLQIAPAGMQNTIYTDIRQGASESFSSFTVRLTQAVDRQVTDEAAKSHLLKSLAFANANQECKRVISAIPGQPSLAEMVEACSKVGTPQRIASIVEERMERVLQVQNETLEKVLANFKKQKSSPEGQCYKCGNFGHFKKNCPQLAKPGKSSELCSRCRRGKHPASECYSLTDFDVKQLPILGNCKKSTNCQRTRIEVMVITQGTAASQTVQLLGNVSQTSSTGQLQASPAIQSYCHPEHNASQRENSLDKKE
ncbi:endogenous retrovirus group K member 5 Gag polyprotein-like [Catharus ustulatus]|uniref:endogenous retrovirus group K member 5 Gag polyprotein-like n=1 Tax=Catharus ustulatus TaxID=91951 RepID=UPI0014090C14|nr:endogenous retrovirus group K member 5 Gag polyprotein-like [Catharus ustulatus]